MNKIPLEILYDIADHTQHVEQVLNLRQTCRKLYWSLSPLLWSHVYICGDYPTANDFLNQQRRLEKRDVETRRYKSSELTGPNGQFFDKNCGKYCENPFAFSNDHNCVQWCMTVFPNQLSGFISYLTKVPQLMELIKLLQIRNNASPFAERVAAGKLTQLINSFVNQESMPQLETIELVNQDGTEVWQRIEEKFVNKPGLRKRLHFVVEKSVALQQIDESLVKGNVETISIKNSSPVLRKCFEMFGTRELPPCVQYVEITAPRVRADEFQPFLKHVKHLKLNCKIVKDKRLAEYREDWIPENASHLTFMHDYDIDLRNNSSASYSGNTNLVSAKLEGELAAVSILQRQMTHLVRLVLSRVPGENLAGLLEQPRRTTSGGAKNDALFFDAMPKLRQITFEHNAHQHIIQCMKHATMVRSLVIRKGGDPTSSVQSSDCNLYQLVRVCTNLDFFLHEGTYDGLPTSVLAYFSFYCRKLNQFYVVSQKHGALPFGIPSLHGPTNKPLWDGYSLITNLDSYYLLDMNSLFENRRKP